MQIATKEELERALESNLEFVKEQTRKRITSGGTVYPTVMLLLPKAVEVRDAGPAELPERVSFATTDPGSRDLLPQTAAEMAEQSRPPYLAIFSPHTLTPDGCPTVPSHVFWPTARDISRHLGAYGAIVMFEAWWVGTKEAREAGVPARRGELERHPKRHEVLMVFAERFGELRIWRAEISRSEERVELGDWIDSSRGQSELERSIFPLVFSNRAN